MYTQQGGSLRPMRPYRPPPNYTARRIFAATVLFLVLWLLWTIVGAVFGGGGGDDESVGAGATSSSVPVTTTTLVAPDPCAVLDNPTAYGRPEDWYRTIVDTAFAVDPFYEPPDLVSASAANYAAEFRIREFMAVDLNRMRNAILEAGVAEVGLIAGYRSIDEQASLFDRRVAELGEDEARAGTAAPGHSEHHLGTAIDVRPIGQSDVDESFGETATGIWLEENSWRYGFVLSYPEGKEAVTCYKYEPWHFRYVGVDLAVRVEESGLTFREYLWHWENTGSEPFRTGPQPLPTTTASSTTVAPSGG